MSAREQQFTGLPREGLPPIPFDNSIQAAQGQVLLHRWAVQVVDITSGEERCDEYLAASADDAELAAHHDAIEANQQGTYSVRSLGMTGQRALWDVRLNGRAQLREALPTDEPLLVGRVVALSMEEARTQALADFGRSRIRKAADAWRYVQPGDFFSVVPS